ncbi:MAG: TerC/Alx family metal homeostasis membrane protein [Terriglobales bacterium]
MNQPLFWILFILFVVAMLGLDLGLHRRSQLISLRKALIWSAAWFGLAAAFAALIYFWQGRIATLEFTTAYVIELSLSVDNLFIFLLIFRYFRVPAGDQHKALFWGVIGAILMRGIFIVIGVGLFRKFGWVIYFFGALLIYSGIRFATKGDSEVNPEKSWMLKLFRRFIPVTDEVEGDKFFVRRARLYATPLLLVLLLIETTDVLFATDSIPAVLAITLDVGIIFTSNVFAILGLRSMYFALAGMMGVFKYLHYGLSAVLIFVGTKMLIGHYYQMPTNIALITVSAILLASVVASVSEKRKEL